MGGGSALRARGWGTLPGMEPPAAGSASPSPWLADLEQRVRQAVAEIGRLRQENRRLERELAKLKKAGGDGTAAWERERGEVRERVERLARHLEGLLGDSGEGDAEAGGPSSAAR